MNGGHTPTRRSIITSISFDDANVALYSEDNDKSLSTPAINRSSDGFDLKDVNKSASDSELL